MRGCALLVLLLATGLSGCVDESIEKLPEAPTAFILDDPALLPPPTLSEPPVYVRGEWWTYDVQGELGGLSDQVRIVAADANRTHQFLGMPTEDFSDVAVLNHFPVQGEVDRETLGVDMHGHFLPLLRFPLEDGKTWKATIVTEAEALVTVHNDTTAEVLFTGGLLPIRIIYDATLRTITQYEVPGLGTAKLVDHGHGHTGEVDVMKDFWLNMWGTAAGVVSLGPDPITQTGAGVEAGLPVETVQIPDREAASYFLYAGNFAILPANTPGTYRVEATLPDGTTAEALRTPADGLGGTGHVGHSDAPGGAWELTHVTVGGGVALTEVAVYDLDRYTV